MQGLTHSHLCLFVVSSTSILNHFLFTAPGTPSMIPEECSAENNSVTIAWAPHHTSCVTGYTLEIDDGAGGAFRVCLIEFTHVVL